MSKRDSQDQLKRRIVKLQEENEELMAATTQMQQAVDAILREVLKQYGKRNDKGELVLVMPTPNLLSKDKVLAAKEGESYMLTLREVVEDEEQVGEPCTADA